MTTNLLARMETASFLFLQKIKRYSGQPEAIFEEAKTVLLLKKF
jgi:hypothetical protein